MQSKDHILIPKNHNLLSKDHNLNSNIVTTQHTISSLAALFYKFHSGLPISGIKLTVNSLIRRLNLVLVKLWSLKASRVKLLQSCQLQLDICAANIFNVRKDDRHVRPRPSTVSVFIMMSILKFNLKYLFWVGVTNIVR